MARPHRPNPSDAPKGSNARKQAHVKQETRRERKRRLHEEAMERQAACPVERTRKYRLAQQAK